MLLEDIIVRYIDMPDSCNGFIMESPDGYGNVYLNKNKPEEVQKKTFIHEVRHKLYGHLKDYDKPVEVCEQEAEYGKDPDAATPESNQNSEYSYPN